MYNVSEFSKLIGKSVKTLQRWDRTGLLSPSYRSITNRRMYTREQYLKYVQHPFFNDKKIVLYARVSSFSQKKDLENQVDFIENYCTLNSLSDYILFTDIGSGLNYKRKNFLKIVKMILRNEVSEIILTHKDRLVRFGFEFFEWLCSEFNVKITIINEEKTSPQQELCKDLMSIIHVFSSRLYGLRKYNFNEICKEDTV